MKTFVYQAIDKNLKKTEGKLESKTRHDALVSIQNTGLTVTHIEEKVDFSLSKLSEIQFGAVPVNDRLIFTKQLAVMLSSGITITAALESLLAQISTGYFKRSLTSVYKDIKNGESIYNAFSQTQGIFTEVQLNLIKAGEKSGNLVEIIKKIAYDIERNKSFVGKVRNALIYPGIVFAVAIGVTYALLVFLIPSMQQLFKEMNAEDKIPWITKVMIQLSNLLSPTSGPYFYIILSVVIVGFIALRTYFKTPGGSLIYTKVYSRIPVLGELGVKFDTAQFCRILSMLLSSGINISEAIKITAGGISNQVMRTAVLNIVPEIEKGGTIANALSKEPLFSKVLVRMIATGELSGNLDVILSEMAKFYEDEVDALSANISKVIEPVVLLVVAAIVGIIVISVYLPIYSISQFVN